MQNTYQPTYHESKEIYISEPGIYKWIFSSELPIATIFKTWIFEDVHPSIRKHGEYKIKE